MELKIIAVAIIIISVLGGLVVMEEKKIAQLHKEREQALAFANAETSNTTFYKNKLGRETAKTELLDLTLRNTRELRDNERLVYLGQFAGINQRLNNLDEMSQIHLRFFRNFKLPLRDTVMLNIDSTLLPAKVFSYKDSLNIVQGTIQGKEIQPHIEIKVPLQGVVYWQRKKILGLRIGRKKWYSDITSVNPFVKITSQELIRVNKK
ncbi:MAG: hypothetical protein JSS93_04130 [Bacteroidetes bacterium]|nr:hypothetical protein [Bacteroidota bacterium]MBS1981686.1 hypothetical protein [Bacteroidota bacterium]